MTSAIDAFWISCQVFMTFSYMFCNRISDRLETYPTHTQANEQIVQGGLAARRLRQVAGLRGGSQLATQSLVFVLVKIKVGFRQVSIFGAGQLAGNQVVNVRQFRQLIEP